MKIIHYSLNEEKTNSKLLEFVKYKIPLTLYTPLGYLLTFIHSIKEPSKSFKYNVSLCLIFKDEGPYLKEWIEYHLLIGIDHFYLYNNNSTDNYQEILKPYIEKGIVTLIEFPEQYAQLKAYSECYRNTKDETQWLGYIDADEYINLLGYNSIKDLLKTVDRFPSVYLNWRMFGTSGHLVENLEELTIERYTQAWANLSSTGKGFINNNYSNHSVSVHFHKTKYLGFPLLGVLANKTFFRNLHFLTSRNVGNIAYINHYWSRSREFYNFKDYSRGSAVSEKNSKLRKNRNRFTIHELRNITKDFSIQRWLSLLKTRMGEE